MQTFDDVIKRLSQSIKQSTEDFEVVGKPIACCDGSVVLPISKISIGFVGGGSEVENGKNMKAPTEIGGGGVSIMPMGFLFCGAQKKYVSVDNATDNKWADFARSALNLLKKDD